MSIVFENKLEIIVFLPDGRARRRGRSPTHRMRCSGDITPNDPQILLPLFYRWLFPHLFRPALFVARRGDRLWRARDLPARSHSHLGASAPVADRAFPAERKEHNRRRSGEPNRQADCYASMSGRVLGRVQRRYQWVIFAACHRPPF